MNGSYFELQQEHLSNSPEFDVGSSGELSIHGVDLMALIKEHGTPLKVTYLPKIGSQIKQAKKMFKAAFDRVNYQGTYTYCYCTKSAHFSFILEEVLKHDTHIETSSAFDLPIVQKLYQAGKITQDTFIVCNGYKRPEYTLQISKLIDQGFKNVIPVLDNEKELDAYLKKTIKPFKIGLRIATEEMPNYSFYTSRLGINPNKIFSFYHDQVKHHDHVELKMLHFFINTGIKDHAYYWNELDKCLRLYVRLKRSCDSLDSLNIGGGLPFKTHLSYQYDYQDFIDKIIAKIHETCTSEKIKVPHIFTEFGTYTVAESSFNIFEVLDEKQQNDKESWYMVNNSFMNTVPDAWGIDQRFIVLPINKWKGPYKHVYLGGLTCDSMDFYNAEIHNGKLFLPPVDEAEPLYVGLFNTGAYQDALSGFGGLKHCLVPSPKYLVLDKNENGEVLVKEFKEEQSATEMLNILGYK
jgi:arginine decarboxylase